MSWIYNAIEHRREDPFNELFGLFELGEQLSELTLTRAINVLTEYITELAAVHREFSFNFSIQKTKAPLRRHQSSPPSHLPPPAQARPPTHSAFMLSHILTVLWGGIVFVSFIFVYNVHTHTHSHTHVFVRICLPERVCVCVCEFTYLYLCLGVCLKLDFDVFCSL